MEYFSFIVFFSFLVLISLLAKDEPATRIGYYFIAVVVALFVGLRGILDEYTRLYVQVLPLSEFFTNIDLVGIQKGYLFAFLCSVLKTLGFGSQSLLLVFALSSVLIHAYYFRQFTSYYFLAFLIYLSHEIYFHDWVQIRAGLSSALMLPMIYCLVHRKKRGFYLLAIASFLIQYVGIMSLAMKWLQKEIKAKYLLIGLLGASTIALANVVGPLIKFFGEAGLLPEVVRVYTIWSLYNYDIGILHLKTVQELIIILAAIYLRTRCPSHPSPYFTLVFNIFYLGTFLAILFSDMRIFSTRFLGHFYVLEPVFLVMLSRYFVERKTYSFAIACMAVLVAFLNYISKGVLPPYEMFVESH